MLNKTYYESETGRITTRKIERRNEERSKSLDRFFRLVREDRKRLNSLKEVLPLGY